jgi:hypothetical protein
VASKSETAATPGAAASPAANSPAAGGLGEQAIINIQTEQSGPRIRRLKRNRASVFGQADNEGLNSPPSIRRRLGGV